MQESEKNKDMKELADTLAESIREFSSKNNLNSVETICFLDKIKENILNTQKISPEIPLNIFQKDLGCLESISLYLKDVLNLKFSEISKLISRDQRTVWTAYNKAKQKTNQQNKTKNKKQKTKDSTNSKQNKKQTKQTISIKSKYSFPASILTDRNLSVLEAIVAYLKSQHNLSFAEIASLLNRAPQNIWAVYNKKKEGIK